MRTVAIRISGYGLLLLAVVIGVTFFALQSQHDRHLEDVAYASENGLPYAGNDAWVSAYPEPSVALFGAGVVLALVAGLLVLEPGLRHALALHSHSPKENA